MPKPVLSDSLFNADDVATAVLAEANLQITNSNLGVTDKSSLFTIQSGWNANVLEAYSFNGFMFVSSYFTHAGSTPANEETIWYINDSNFHPSQEVLMPSISHQGDYALSIKFQTDGNVKVRMPVNAGADTTWYGIINGWYRFA